MAPHLLPCSHRPHRPAVTAGPSSGCSLGGRGQRTSAGGTHIAQTPSSFCTVIDVQDRGYRESFPGSVFWSQLPGHVFLHQERPHKLRQAKQHSRAFRLCRVYHQILSSWLATLIGAKIFRNSVALVNKKRRFFLPLPRGFYSKKWSGGALAHN